jgi:hypothetical protein
MWNSYSESAIVKLKMRKGLSQRLTAAGSLAIKFDLWAAREPENSRQAKYLRED